MRRSPGPERKQREGVGLPRGEPDGLLFGNESEAARATHPLEHPEDSSAGGKGPALEARMMPLPFFSSQYFPLNLSPHTAHQRGWLPSLKSKQIHESLLETAESQTRWGASWDFPAGAAAPPQAPHVPGESRPKLANGAAKRGLPSWSCLLGSPGRKLP